MHLAEEKAANSSPLYSLNFRVQVFNRQGGFLFTIGKHGDASGHLGIPIPYAVMDPRTEIMWASQDHGHWGQKLTRSRDGGEAWEEVEQPKYPESAELTAGEPATMRYIWVIQPGGDDERDRIARLKQKTSQTIKKSFRNSTDIRRDNRNLHRLRFYCGDTK